MSVRTSRFYKFLLWGLTLACLGGAGYLGYRMFSVASTPVKLIKDAEAAYALGLESYKQKNMNDAKLHFDEARIMADNALKVLNEDASQGKLTADQKRALDGQLHWIRARAIRDLAYAQSQIEGKPLQDVMDPQYNEWYRAVVAMPDSKIKDESYASLITAAQYTADPEMVKESLRAILVQPQIPWVLAEPLLRIAVDQNPKDARSLYFLARYEFEQPVGNAGTPTPPADKSLERIDKARALLASAKAAGISYWRAVGLEAAILNWYVDTAVSRKIKSSELEASEKAVDQLLFDPRDGAVMLAGKGEKLTNLTQADMIGQKSVFLIGMSRAITEVRKPSGNTEKLKTVADAALSLAKKSLDDPALAPIQADAISNLVDVASASQPYLPKADAAAWRDFLSGVDQVLDKAQSVTKARPLVRLQMAKIALHDADFFTQKADPERVKELRERAIKQAEEGIKTAEEAKLPENQIEEFHLIVAEWGFLTGKRAEAIEPHIKKLRESTIAQAKAVGQFFEGVLLERQGRLEKAQKIFQALASDRTNRDMVFRSNLELARIALATNNPTMSLSVLRELEPLVAKRDTLSSVDKAWASQFSEGVDEILALEIKATLEVALQVARREALDNPGKKLSGELLMPHESSVEGMLKKLRTPSTSDRKARLFIVRYLRLTNRRDVAEVRVAQLATDYPESIDVLRERTELLASPANPAESALNPNGVAAANNLIKKFMRDYPANITGKFYWAEWLVRTDRAKEAIEFLNDASQFPNRTEAVKGLLAAALYRVGQRDEAQKIISTLTPSTLIDLALIRAAGTREAEERKIKDAIDRYENAGIFRIYDAALRLSEGKFEEAIRGFTSALEFTQVGERAREGLLKALLALGDADPVKGREAAIRLSAELPNESLVYLAAAFSALSLEDVGNPEDKWAETKTMFAAVNQWEAAETKAGRARQEVLFGKSLFRYLMGDLEAARGQALTTLSQYPKHVPSMLLLVDLFLLEPRDVARAKEFYEAAVKENPKHPDLPYIDARLKTLSGDLAGATAIYQRLIEDNPVEGNAYGYLVVSLEPGDPKAALRWAREWMDKVPADRRAVREIIRLLTQNGEKEQALKMADEYVNKSVETARKQIADHQPPLTKEEADKTIANARADALLLEVTAFVRAKAYPEAETRALEVMKTHPTSIPALLVMGSIAQQQNQWNKALDLYKSVLKLNPRQLLAGNNAAWILSEKKNNPAAALAIVDEIRKSRDGSKPIAPQRLPSEFLDTIGTIYIKLNQPSKFDEMRSMFEAAVRRYATDPRMYIYLAHAQAGTGERSKALESLDAAIRIAGTKNVLTDQQNKDVITAAEALKKRISG